MSLIPKRPYGAITIKEICSAAKVSRSTFYAHYSSKDELKRDGLEHLRARLLHETSRAGVRKFAFSLPMFQHAHDHLRVYGALAASHGRVVALTKIREVITEVVEKELVAYQLSDTAPLELIVEHVVTSFMSMMTWWLDGGAKLSPDTMDATFRRFIIQGIRSTDNRPNSHD